LRAFFNIPQPPDAPEPDELVLVRAYKLELGLLAHEVTGVVAVPPAAIKPLDNTPYALGLTTGRVVLLNLEQLFADERLIVGGGLTQDA
jgi:chemotaxis signal transduction protein